MKHRNDLTKTESRKLCLLLLHLAIAVGIVAGAVIASSKKVSDMLGLWWLHQYFPPAFSGNTVLAVFRNTFLSSLLFLLIAMLLGFFAIGQPLAIFLLGYRGVGIGVSVSMMYMTSGMSSMPTLLILLLPKALALSFTASLAVRETLRLSGVQFKFLFNDDSADDNMQKVIKLYFIKFIVLTAITFVIAVLDSLMNYFFMDLY